MRKIAIILALMLVLGTVLLSGCTQIPSMGGEDQGSGQDGGQDSDSGSGNGGDDSSSDDQGGNGGSGDDNG